MARLSVESDEMRRKWALLTDRAREMLIKQSIKCQDLKMLIKCPFNKLLNLFENEMSIDDLFLKLYDHLSFFDHEFLCLVIKRYCAELTQDLDIYVSDLKQYCRRRVVEVPADVFKEEDADESSLFVKCDKSFESVILEDILSLESRLSQLLGVDLFLLRVDDGCTELVFEAMCPVFPLTKPQREQLAEMGVLKLYSLHYKNDKAPPSPDTRILKLVASGSDSEMDMIAEEVQLSNKVQKLAEALEMSFHFEGTSGDAKELLKQWQKQSKIPNFLQRPYLLHHLANIGMQDLHTKSV